MSIAPLASQSAQPIVVPTSVTQASANTTQASASSKNNADQKQNADTGSQTKNASQPPSNGVNLNDPEVKKVIAQLQARDQEVRVHEQAHVAAGGQYVTSGPSYSYQTGPDGKRYAVGGNVGIDVSPVADDPEATLAKARQVIQAAMAPAEPSSQDYAVAQSAQSMMLQAQQEISAQNNASAQDSGKSVSFITINATINIHNHIVTNKGFLKLCYKSALMLLQNLLINIKRATK